MHVGIDARLWNETGVGRYIRNLVKNLQKIDKENQYTLFVLSKDKKNIQFQISNFKFQMVTADIRWHSVEEQQKFPGLIARQKLDLMHFPYFSVPIFYNGPFIVTIHDLILHHFATGEATTLPYPIYRVKLEGYRYIIKRAAQKAQKIITVSEATKKEIIDHLKVKSEKVIVTYEGVEEITNHKSQIPNKFQNPITKFQNGKWKMENGKFFLHVGNVYPHKNVDRLLEAFGIFINNFQKRDSIAKFIPIKSGLQNDIKLVFVGREDYFFRKLKEKVDNLDLNTHIQFLGEVSDDELTYLYQHAIATVVPSLMEGFGLPAVEAMANRCLVLASDIPSLREVCGDAAIYCDPQRSKSIAECLEKILTMSRDEKEKKIASGLAKIQQYSWEKMAEQMLSVYNSLI